MREGPFALEELSLWRFAMLHVLLRYGRTQILHFHVQYTPKDFQALLPLRAETMLVIVPTHCDVRDTNL